MKTRIKLFLSIAVLIIMGSCTTLKPYQRVYVDDTAMQIGIHSGEAFEHYVESIREGGAHAGSGKSGGGCGCN